MFAHQKFISGCDKVMVFSFCAMIYFLPISIAILEIFTALALVTYLLKRLALFFVQICKGTLPWMKLPLLRKVSTFIISFKPVDNYLNVPIALYLVFNLISTLFSQYPSESWRGFLGKVLQNAFIYFNFIECMNSVRRLRVFLAIFFISAFLISVNGVYQNFQGVEFIHGEMISEGRVASSFRSPNDFAAYLVFIIPVLLPLVLFCFIKRDVAKDISYFCSSSVIKRVFLLSLFLLCTISFVFTSSRGAWISFAVSVVFLMASFNKWKKKIFMAIILVLSLGLFCFSIAQRVSFRVMESIVIDNGRLGYWHEALEIAKDYPLFGTGVNTYSSVGRDYKIVWGGYPHNCYLQMTAETGLVGLTTFLWMIGFCLVKTKDALRRIKNRYYGTLLCGFWAGLIGFFVHGFFDTVFYSVQLSSLMWLIMGLIMVIQTIGMQWDEQNKVYER